MNYFKMKRSKYKERFITDILMGDMESGDVGFLIYAYNKLGLRGNKRIRQMWKTYKKISQNPAYEDIIRIIVEEIFQKGNKELFNDLMAYYLKRFPDVKEGFENSEDNIEEWVKIYDGPDNKSDSGLPSFLRKSFVMLYCVTYGEPGVVKGFLTIWGEWRNEHYMDGKYSFYDKQRNRGTTIQMLCEHAGAINSRYIHRQYEEIIKQQRKEMADYYEIEEDEIEEFVLESILHSTENLREIDNSLYAVEFENIQDGLNHICKKYHMNQLELWDYSNWQHYLDMIKDIFIDWCKRECRNFMLLLLFPGRLHGRSNSFFYRWLRRVFIKVCFRFIKKGKLSCNLIQFFRMAAETLLVCKAHLFDKAFVIMLQPVKTVLHLIDDIIFGLMVHRIQFIRCKFSAHTDRLSL